jgi:hypothetical protein
MRGCLQAIQPLGLCLGQFFELDFQTLPFHGEDALVRKPFML